MKVDSEDRRITNLRRRSQSFASYFEGGCYFLQNLLQIFSPCLLQRMSSELSEQK